MVGTRRGGAGGSANLNEHPHNSPGHWPIGVLDNQLYWLIVPPIVPHWSPGARRTLILNHWIRWLGPLFPIFQLSRKSSKNWPFKKLVFFAIFVILGSSRVNILVILATFGSHLGSLLGVFLPPHFWFVFFYIFSAKTRKTKNMKNAFRPVKYDTSWGSLGCKKNKESLKKAMEKQRCLWQKSTKNRPKTCEKTEITEKLTKALPPCPHFPENMHFRWILGFGRVPQI